MARLRPPKVTEKPVPVFTSVELSELQKACQGKTFAGRRDAAIKIGRAQFCPPGHSSDLRLRPQKVTEKPVPVFTSVELSELQKACQGKTFAGRRDAAIIAVFRAPGAD